MREIESLMQSSADLSPSCVLARRAGEEHAVGGFFRDASGLTVDTAYRTAESEPHHADVNVLEAATALALDCCEVAEAKRLMDEAHTVDASTGFRGEDAGHRDVAAWPDAWLVAAVRRDPPDVPALDALADRYWKALFGRCHLLTLDEQKASDLAQEAWCRVLRARHRLKPDGNFPAYLTTIATNIWRDWHRSMRRAGPMAQHRMASLDAALSAEDGETIALADMLPDLNANKEEQQRRLMLDIDNGLEKLPPELREVLVSRFLDGESCAEIGERLGRTEQTISAWVREAIRQIKLHFGETGRGTGNNES